MSASNTRIKDYNTVHHLTSRIAHRVYFLGEDERNDLIEMVRRVSQFSGIKLLSWCIMTNHFHLLVYLPQRVEIDEDEVLSRYAILKGSSARRQIESQLSVWRSQGDQGKKRVDEWLARQRERMYDVGEFMKIVKQWLSEEYNRRTSHVGTLWESVYYDRTVEYKESAIAKCAAYIHLNPIRAAVCSEYAEYIWSSYTALSRGDEMALDGMRYIYGMPKADCEYLMAKHKTLMDDLLEDEKRRRAIEIARKRLSGYDVPCDHLTTDAMIAQAEAHCKMVINAGVSLSEGDVTYRKCKEKRENIERDILASIRETPYISIDEIAKRVNTSKSTVYRYIDSMRRRGEVFRSSKAAPWSVLKFSN